MEIKHHTLVIGIDPGATGSVAGIYGDQIEITSIPIIKETLKSKNKKSGKFKMRSHLNAPGLHEVIEIMIKNACAHYKVRPFDLKIFVLIEKVHGIFGDGATQAFGFGEIYGGINAVVRLFQAGWQPYDAFALSSITPAKWKKALQVPSGRVMTKSQKNAAMNEIVKTIVKGKIKAANIDAVGIALVAREATAFFNPEDLHTQLSVVQKERKIDTGAEAQE